ncbi:MAG: glycogen/starch synthase [FCB group bacterium]|nr:glycogen/starch synthase [FCB group bacterium]
MPLKIYYLTSETAPFCGTNLISTLTRKVSTIYNEDPEIDIRIVQPKYGFISERKYVIREVIRLREIPVTFGGETKLVNLKSAFIPESRVQVYFMQYDEYFKQLPELLYKARNGRIYKDNDDKFTFFGEVAVNALKLLFWVPDVIICADWQTSMVPAILKKYARADEFYKNIKSAFLLSCDNSDYRYFSRETYEKVGLEPATDDSVQDNLKFAVENSDYLFTVDDENSTLKNRLNKDSKLKNALQNRKNTLITIPKEAKREDWKTAAATIKSTLLDN